MPRPDSGTPREPSSKENLYSIWIDEDRSEKSSLRASIVVAVIFHMALLAATFPEMAQELNHEKEERTIFVMQQQRFKPPPPPPPDNKIPPPRTKKIPIPDPDPETIEPYVSDEELTVDLDLHDYDMDLVFRPPDAPPEPETEDKIFIAGGQIGRPERIHYVEPRYTEMARKARIQGFVILQAILGKQGEVTDLKVLKPLPMGLTEEAVRAVEQWRYRPSMLNGRPVSVLLNVTVHFRLQ